MPRNLKDEITQPTEVTKTRRNLVLLSFLTIGYLLLSPQISEIKVAGIEVRFSGNKHFSILLLAALAFESITFVYRFYVSHFGTRLNNLQSELSTIKKELIKKHKHSVQPHQNNAEGNALCVFENIEKRLVTKVEELQSEYSDEIKTVINRHRIVELYLPISLAAFAATMCATTIFA